MNLPKSSDELKDQIKQEYRRAYDWIQPKRTENLDRMRLYSNQRRNKELIGDTTLFTIFQTVLSKLYEDKLSVQFIPSHPDDDEDAEALNPVARYDYHQMDKDQLDYNWDWYTLFWGAGFLDLSEWDSKKSIMNPSVIDNATFLIDPNCSLINGDKRGFGAAKFWGREIAKTKNEMESEGTYENFKDLQVARDTLQDYNQLRRADAQNVAKQEFRMPGDNELIPLIEWWTHINGDKYLLVTDANFTEILRCQKWNFKKWPIVHRKVFPIPGDPIGVSIPDLIEDKQRAKSVLSNLGLMSAKAALYPMFVYDRNSVSPNTDFTLGFNKGIGVDGNVTAAFAPIQKSDPGPIVQYIMSIIDNSAQRATAATDNIQGQQGGASRSANEAVRSFNQAEDRISVGSKVFGWSERDFWWWWLKMYQKYFTAASKKFIRIEGAFGPKFVEITGDSFDFTEDPDIMIESKVLVDAKNQEEKNDAVAFVNITQQDQSMNRSYLNKILAKKFGWTSDQIQRLYPPSVDELKAEAENNKLEKNQIVPIDINDDHITHLQVHAKADDTKASIVHIEAHKRAMMMKRKQDQTQQALQGNAQPSPTAQPLSQQAGPQPGQGSPPAAQNISPNAVQQ